MRERSRASDTVSTLWRRVLPLRRCAQERRGGRFLCRAVSAEEGAAMDYLKAAAGALAIMTASGMIADFDVSVWDNDVYGTVWSADDQPDGTLRKHVAAILPNAIDESRIFVNRDGVIAV
jgi:hypothetical protein